MTIEFQPWPKTPRFNRDVIITEKIDGTNAAIIIDEVPEHMLHTAAAATHSFDEMLACLQTGLQGVSAMAVHEDKVYWVGAQSRKRLIVPGDDNFGFAAWVAKNAEQLVAALGPGRHFGEWWGSGIQRGYGLSKGEKRFSLFNTERYAHVAEITGGLIDIVPELYRGPLNDNALWWVKRGLEVNGSVAAPGFMDPEGFIIFHTAARQVFKVLLEGDDTHKGA